jgi:dienelactone hydrolase
MVCCFLVIITHLVQLTHARLNVNNATWEITRYSGVQHAFTNFLDARYNEVADSRSWLSMDGFLAEAFGKKQYMGMEPNMFSVEAINYNDTDDTMLRGYLSMPSADMFVGPHPAVIIIPDWDGVNLYEKKRATLMAEQGYISFAADIYGKDLQEGLDIPTRSANSGKYRGNATLFIQRITAAVNLLKEHPLVDSNNIAIFGYCFGGTGVIEYAFSGMGVKAIVSMHGGLTSLPKPGAAIKPYVLVLSGGIDDVRGNQTEMEDKLNKANATWEITRYANVNHAFTVWGQARYNLMADARSFASSLSLLNATMPPELKTFTSTPIMMVTPSPVAMTTRTPSPVMVMTSRPVLPPVTTPAPVVAMATPSPTLPVTPLPIVSSPTPAPVLIPISNLPPSGGMGGAGGKTKIKKSGGMKKSVRGRS